MVQKAGEVPEAQADSKTKVVYEDIKSVLGVPLVPLLFRRLAISPDYLQMAWRALKPNAQTVYFEQSAEDIRLAALENVTSLRLPSGSTAPTEHRDLLVAVQFLTSKIFLSVAAIRAATSGLPPKLADLPRDAKRQITPGIPANLKSASGLDSSRASEGILSVFSEIQNTMGEAALDIGYDILSQNENDFINGWQIWKNFSNSQDLRVVERNLRRAADECVSTMPFRMDLYPHALRHAGLSEAEIDEIRGLLAEFYLVLPRVVSHIAFLSAASGPPDTAKSVLAAKGQ